MHNFHATDMRSHREIAIQRWLSSLGINSIEKYKGLGFEIDLYLPKQKVGFEFNGIAWHCSSCNHRIVHCKPKSHNYHYLKTLNALQNGVLLYHFWDFEATKDVKIQINGILNGKLLSTVNADKNPSLVADTSLKLEPRYIVNDRVGLYAVGVPLESKPLCWLNKGVTIYEYYNSGYRK